MSETPWQETNDAYLAAGVEWIRLLLTRRATAARPAQEPPAASERQAASRVTPPPKPWWAWRRGDPAPQPPPPLLALPPASFEVTEEQVAEAAQRMERAQAASPPPALVLLAKRFGLSDFARNTLLLCAAVDLDTRVAALCARVHDDPARPYPTFALASAVFEQPSWDTFSPDAPLRYWRLIEINLSTMQPLTMSALRADERIVNQLKGLPHLDERIAPFVMQMADHVHPEDLPDSHRAIAEEIGRALERDRPQPLPVQLLGRDSDSKQLIAQAAAHEVGLTLYRLPADLLPQQAADLETIARLWQRETMLLPVALYVDARDIDRNDAHAVPLKRFLARASGVVFVDGRESWPVAKGTTLLDVERPTSDEQLALWLAVLGDDERESAERLASQFNLSGAAIERIASQAAGADNETSLTQRLWSAAAQQTRMHIDVLAQRIDAKAKWEQIVLPQPELDLLHQIAEHVAGRATVFDRWGFRERMNRGFGISALFAGASGTGKTMAAEVIANHLGQSLHRIDLSSVVSKWVGETEKNLERLFHAADDSNGILFFDEADALFGKRTEVQHSQDRFANIEINFLLQRLESYRGLAILATNMRDALDSAFLRRLRFIVQFPFPGPVERRQIWEKVFPAATPREGLDFDRLARINLTGGSIHNIALSAAFLAAAREGTVTMDIVVEATRAELRKLDKPVNESELPRPEPRELRAV